MMLIPKEDFEIEHTWNTVAQRGTGSNKILLKIYSFQNTEPLTWLLGVKGERHLEEVSIQAVFIAIHYMQQCQFV